MSFNHSQEEAIRHFKGPALVLAGPGSGKTTVITHRTKQLIESYHVEPEHILVITFTRAAALEMKERFMNLMDGKRTAVTFGTFHSVFFSYFKICLSLSCREYCQRRRTTELYTGDYTKSSFGNRR